MQRGTHSKYSVGNIMAYPLRAVLPKTQHNPPFDHWQRQCIEKKQVAITNFSSELTGWRRTEEAATYQTASLMYSQLKHQMGNPQKF